MNAAILEVSPEYLAAVLLLPCGYRITSAGWDRWRIELRVEAPGIPETAPGAEPPRMQAVYHRVTDAALVALTYGQPPAENVQTLIDAAVRDEREACIALCHRYWRPSDALRGQLLDAMRARWGTTP
jgi:hypothetical protein